MSKIGTIVELVGKAWARAADGAVRELVVGEQVKADETIILAAGALLRVQEGDGKDAPVFTIVGPEPTSPAIVAPHRDEAQAASDDLVKMVVRDAKSSDKAAEEGGEERAGDGFRFVQLVRIGEDVEAGAITPLTLARIKELIPPMELNWPHIDHAPEQWPHGTGGGNDAALNPSPDLLPETQVIAEDEVATGNVLANDSDPKGRPLQVTRFEVGGESYEAGETASIPGVGTIVIQADGSYVFTPVADWNGTVPTITYVVSSDGRNDGGSSTLDIEVTPVVDIVPDAIVTHAGDPVVTPV
ncbi:MAG: hypothetical protein EP321_13060, partial [Sphingomonadales bacterium]